MGLEIGGGIGRDCYVILIPTPYLAQGLGNGSITMVVESDRERRITQLQEEGRRMKAENELKSEQIQLLLTK